MILCGARWYNASMGRWVSRDPIGYGGGPNLYEYCGSDPINFVDTSGAIPKWLRKLGDIYAGLMHGAANSLTTGTPIDYLIPGLGELRIVDSLIPNPKSATAGDAYQVGKWGTFLLTMFTPAGAEKAGGTCAQAAANSVYFVAFEVRLPKTLYPGFSRLSHYREANRTLAETLRSSAEFAAEIEALIPKLLQRITGPGGGIRDRAPTGWVWHHAVEVGVMQLVPKVQHTVGSQFWRLMHSFGKGLVFGDNIWYAYTS